MTSSEADNGEGAGEDPGEVHVDPELGAEPGVEIEISGPAGDDAGDQAGDQGPIDRESFFAMFRALCGAPNGILMAKGVEPFRAFDVPPDDHQARAASDALYDTCRDVPWLNFILEPDNIWIQRAAPVLAFGFTRVQMFRAEAADRKRQARAPGGRAADAGGAEAPADEAPGRDQGVEVARVEVPADG